MKLDQGHGLFCGKRCKRVLSSNEKPERISEFPYEYYIGQQRDPVSDR